MNVTLVVKNATWWFMPAQSSPCLKQCLWSSLTGGNQTGTVRGGRQCGPGSHQQHTGHPSGHTAQHHTTPHQWHYYNGHLISFPPGGGSLLNTATVKWTLPGSMDDHQKAVILIMLYTDVQIFFLDFWYIFSAKLKTLFEVKPAYYLCVINSSFED